MVTNIDAWLFELIQRLHHPLATTVFIFVTHLGDWRTLLFLSAITASTLWLKKRQLEATMLIGVFALSQGLVYFLKHFLARARPDVGSSLITQTGFSLPSGHAFGAIAFYGFLAYLLLPQVKKKGHRQLIVITTGTLVFLIGFSRVYLGVHWPSDVIAGFGLGLFILIISIFTIRQLKNIP